MQRIENMRIYFYLALLITLLQNPASGWERRIDTSTGPVDRTETPDALGPLRYLINSKLHVDTRPIEPPKDVSIRTMTFNIRYNTPRDGHNSWPHRKQMVADIIRKYRVDIGGLQEPDKGQINALKKLLPEYGWFGVQNAIFYRIERFELKRGSKFWLSKTPNKPSRGWDAQENRIVRWGLLKDKISGEEFYVFNTHFDNVGKTAREKSARLLLNKALELPRTLPTVVFGDFNCGRSSEPYSILSDTEEKSKRLRDAFFISKNNPTGPIGTFNGFKKPSPQRAIDFIFIKGDLVVNKHSVISDSIAGRFPSDHFPVLAELVFKKENRLRPVNTSEPVYIRAYNIDDEAVVLVNEDTVIEVGYLEDSDWIEISDYMQRGENNIKFCVDNIYGGWTYGFQIKTQHKIIWTDECGLAGKRGCTKKPSKPHVYSTEYIFNVK